MHKYIQKQKPAHLLRLVLYSDSLVLAFFHMSY